MFTSKSIFDQFPTLIWIVSGHFSTRTRYSSQTQFCDFSARTRHSVWTRNSPCPRFLITFYLQLDFWLSLNSKWTQCSLQIQFLIISIRTRFLNFHLNSIRGCFTGKKSLIPGKSRELLLIFFRQSTLETRATIIFSTWTGWSPQPRFFNKFQLQTKFLIIFHLKHGAHLELNFENFSFRTRYSPQTLFSSFFNSNSNFGDFMIIFQFNLEFLSNSNFDHFDSNSMFAQFDFDFRSFSTSNSN